MILRHGVTVRGVTTAAALWISAAIGMATAAGFYAGRGRHDRDRARRARRAAEAQARGQATTRRSETLSLELDLVPGASIRSLLGELRRRNLRVEGLDSQILEDGSERVRLDVRGPASLDVDGILSGLAHNEEVARIDLALLHSPELDGDEDGSPPTPRRRGRLTVPAHR